MDWITFREEAGQLINRGYPKKELAVILCLTTRKLSAYLVGSQRPSDSMKEKILENFKGVKVSDSLKIR